MTKPGTTQKALVPPDWKPTTFSYDQVACDPTGKKHFSLGDFGPDISRMQCDLLNIANADDKTGTLAGFLAKEIGSYGRVTEGYLKNLESRSIIAIKYDGRCIDGPQLRDLRHKVEQIRQASQTILLSRMPSPSY